MVRAGSAYATTSRPTGCSVYVPWSWWWLWIRCAAEFDETAALRRDFRDRAHRAARQGIGARWDARPRRWRVARRDARRLGLAAQIVGRRICCKTGYRWNPPVSISAHG